MHTKRGQIAIFLVVGIVILAIFAFVLFTVQKGTTQKLEVQEKESRFAIETKPQIRSFVESCLEQTALPGVYALGRLGGTLFPDKINSLITEDEVISYGFLDGEIRLSKDKIEEELGIFIEETLDECIDEFTVFANQAFEIEAGEKAALAVVQFDRINLDLQYPLEVSLEENKFNMKDFSATVPVRLGFILKTSEQIIALHEENRGYDLPAYTNMGATIIAFPFDDVTTIFSIYDKLSITEGVPYFFWFALKDEQLNTPPVLGHIPDFVLTKDLHFEFEIAAFDAENDKLTFSSSLLDFPVSEEGLFSFTPVKAGTFFVTITVEDVHGLRDEQTVRFIVESQLGEQI